MSLQQSLSNRETTPRIAILTLSFHDGHAGAAQRTGRVGKQRSKKDKM